MNCLSELGQLIITGVSGKSLTPEEKIFLEEENIGGVILFAANYESPGQLAELVNSIQQARREYPLFISVDHEGGRVQRFRQGFTHFPPMYEIAKLDSPKICFDVHYAMGMELASCGINMNFSPVCDIWLNPQNKVIGDRAFGNDPEIVSKFVSAAIRGLQTAKVIACAKHFPGHGSTLKDSHYDLPIVKTSLDELRNVEMIPFVKAVKSRVEMVMMSHLMVDAIDQECPISLSKNAHQILRKELKFTGLIVTDDLEMKAVTDHFGGAEIAVKALVAGTDILLYRSMESAKIGLDAIKTAKANKILKVDEIAQKVKRIDDLKKSYIAEYSPIYVPNISKQMSASNGQVLLAQIVEKLSNKTTQV